MNSEHDSLPHFMFGESSNMELIHIKDEIPVKCNKVGSLAEIIADL